MDGTKYPKKPSQLFHLLLRHGWVLSNEILLNSQSREEMVGIPVIGTAKKHYYGTPVDFQKIMEHLCYLVVWLSILPSYSVKKSRHFPVFFFLGGGGGGGLGSRRGNARTEKDSVVSLKHSD